MNVEIIGTQFVNKGAELMLLTIINQLKTQNYKNLNICMLPNKILAPTNKLLSYGLYKKLPHVKKGVNIRNIGPLIPKKMRNYCNIIIDQEIDVILEASGFGYSEQWGENSARNLAASVKKWKSQGTKIILLPQAFGPFKSKKLINDMKTVIKYSDLIFARDKTSFDYLTSLNMESDNIHMAPDFTNLLSYDPLIDFEFKNAICITPNKRMLDKSEKGNEYLNLLSKIIEKLDEKKQDYFFLIHEGIHDRNVIDKLTLKKEPKIYQTDDVIEIKKILGSVKGLIGSRFHGLVSALSQGVPSLAIGWSHKYIELFNDYECQENFIDLNSDIKIDEVLELFFNDSKYLKTNNKLLKNSNILKLKSREMWNTVCDKIQNKNDK